MSKKVSDLEAAHTARNFAKKDFHSKSATPRVRVRAANTANAEISLKRNFHSKSATPRARVSAANMANAADFLNPIRRSV